MVKQNDVWKLETKSKAFVKKLAAKKIKRGWAEPTSAKTEREVETE